MSFAEDLAAAKNAALETPETAEVPITVNGKLYTVRVKRVPGIGWDDIVARCPARAEAHFRVGYDTGRATRIALEEHGVLLDADGADVDEVNWGEILEVVSGVEIRAISAAWWGLNEQEPNNLVVALKKASRGGDSTS